MKQYIKKSQIHLILINCVNFVIITALSTGCLRLDQKITIEKDASGSYEASYYISEDTIKRMASMLELQAGMKKIAESEEKQTPLLSEAAFDPTEERLEKILSRYGDFGINVEKLSVESRDAWRNVEIVFKFNDLATLAKADFFKAYGFSIYKSQNGNVIFHKPAISGQKAIPLIKDNKAIHQIAPLLSGFSISTEILLPGKVITSNGTSHSHNSVTWLHNFDNDPNAIVKLQNNPMIAVFSPEVTNLPQIILEQTRQQTEFDSKTPDN